jgi:hypothetical protein
MTAEHPVPAEVAELAAALADQFAEGARGQLAELAELLADRAHVRVVPSDRVTFLTVTLRAGGPPDTVAAAQLDRARVTIVNTGAATVALGGPSVEPARSDRADLAPGAALTIDTRAPIYGAVATGAGDGELTVITEEYDT